MASYTITNTSLSKEVLLEFYTSAKSNYEYNWEELDFIFNIALENPDRFPGININNDVSEQIYIEKWVKGYYDAQNNLPSTRTANPKSACTDPAIRIIVQATQGQDDRNAEFGELTHNLFMSAENIQGNLLEEYISEKVRPYGFLWCDGNVLRAIDFCNTDGTLLLQIKNKSNTENSSSSNIREGTRIEKWYRLGTRTKAGNKIPDYKWEKLNILINENKTAGFDLEPCNMTEEDYQEFLARIATYNKALICGR